MKHSVGRPVVEQLQAFVDEGGQALEREGRGGHPSGNSAGGSGLLRRFARMVPLRPDGDEEACRREASSGTISCADGTRLKTLNRMPARQRRSLPLKSPMSGKRSPAGRWSPMPHPTTGRFSGNSGPRWSTSHVNISLPTSDRLVRQALRCLARRRQRHRQSHPGESPRQGDDKDGGHGSRARAQVFPQAQAPPALREGRRLHDWVGRRRSHQQSAPATGRLRWSIEGGVLTFGAMSGRAAWQAIPAPRTRRRTPSRPDSGNPDSGNKNRVSQK